MRITSTQIPMQYCFGFVFCFNFTIRKFDMIFFLVLIGIGAMSFVWFIVTFVCYLCSYVTFHWKARMVNLSSPALIVSLLRATSSQKFTQLSNLCLSVVKKWVHKKFDKLFLRFICLLVFALWFFTGLNMKKYVSITLALFYKH